MCLYILVLPIPPLPDKFCLILWPAEDSASVVSCQRVCGGTRPGDTCTVKIKGKTHEGKILATGEDTPVSCVQVCVHFSKLLKLRFY